MTGDHIPLGVEAAQIAAAQRDPARFDGLYEDNFDAVYAFVARRVPRRADAEDLTALVFQKALAALPRYEWRGTPFIAWLLTIARNELARRGARPDDAAGTALDAAAEDAQLEDVERRATLFRLLRVLPPDQRRVLVLRFAHDRSVEQVAAELDRTPGAVKQLQFRALQTLRRQRGALDDRA